MSGETYYIGLTMAGAVSAGAYTAGVLDVLFDALDRHNARFEAGRRGDWQGALADHPRHRVVLRVISGTSAGGVSAGLGVAGLIGARRAAAGAGDGWDGAAGGEADGGRQLGAGGDGSFTSADGYRFEYSYILRPLHHVWVEALDLYRSEGGEAGFLATGDLRERPVDSVLNSEHIDDAARVALADITWNGRPFGFVARDLDVFLTTTNLQGVPYEIGFLGGDGAASHSHVMAQHSTVRHFRVSGLGTRPHRSAWLEAWRDRGIGLPLAPGRIDFDADPAWARFRSAALATGAFPVGLSARVIEAQASDFGVAGADAAITGGAWPIDHKPGIDPDTRPKPCLPAGGGAGAGPGSGPAPDLPVRYVAVDGGVANNEPFELARYTLREPLPDQDAIEVGEKFLRHNPREPEAADRAVLMIDPFPEGPTYLPLDAQAARALAGVVPAARRLLPALINQARFKPGELIEATDTRVHSRFLLSPSRRSRPEDGRGSEGRHWLGAEAIASGSFGGFGGFFDRSFRAHDYMLGQRNGHSFLKRYFNLRADNPVLGLPPDRRDPGTMVRVVDAGEAFYAADPPMPPWPRIGQARLDPILGAARRRIDGLAEKVLRDLKLSGFLRFALGSVWKWDLLGGAGDRVALALRQKVLHELLRRDQHEDFRHLAPGRPFAPWQRAVLVALAEAGDQPVPAALPGPERARLRAAGTRPADLLAAVEDEHGVTADQLRGFLDAAEMRDRLWRTPWRAADETRYTLAALRPDHAWKHNLDAVTSRTARAFGMAGRDR